MKQPDDCVNKPNMEDNDDLVDSVWKRQRTISRESFFRRALVELATHGIAPELLFGDFEVAEFDDEFLAVTMDANLDYEFELGTPVAVKANYLGYDSNLHQARDVVLDWTHVKHHSHSIVHTAINKNWDGESVDSTTYQNDKQLFERSVLENTISEQYIRAKNTAKNDDDFPNKAMVGTYTEQPVESFHVTDEAWDRIIEKCIIRTCKEYTCQDYAKNLTYSGHYDITHSYGIVIPRYRLTFKYKNDKYSVVDSLWIEHADLEQSPPTAFHVETDDERRIHDAMMRQIGPNQPEKRDEKSSGLKSFVNKLKILFASPNDKDIVRVKIKVMTKEGVVEKEVRYREPSQDKLNSKNFYEQQEELRIKKDKVKCQRVIALALALERYNLAPMTEDDYINAFEFNR